MFPFESLIDVSISHVRKVVSIGWVGRHERTRFAFFSHSSAECFLYLSNFASKQCEQIRKFIPIWVTLKQPSATIFAQIFGDF